MSRMIHTDISESRHVATLSKEALALFCLLIPHFSSHGKMKGNVHFIKGDVCPYIDWFTVSLIGKCLKEINDKTSVKWFEHDKGMYLQSLNWFKWQKLNKDRLGLDKLPTYSGLTPDEVTPEVKEEVEVEEEVEGKVPPAVIVEIVEYLNLKLGSSYKPDTKGTTAAIKARLKEGRTVEDFKTVIDKKSTEWMGDSKMSKYLTPDTLFGSKFEKYLNQVLAPAKEKHAELKEIYTELKTERKLTNVEKLFFNK